MLLLREQTAEIKLDKQKRNLKGLTFANKCISNQMLDPLQTIDQYADILIDKSQRRPDTLNFLQAIKYCSQMVQFNISNL